MAPHGFAAAAEYLAAGDTLQSACSGQSHNLTAAWKCRPVGQAVNWAVPSAVQE
jgi:hypothetical protein